MKVHNESLGKIVAVFCVLLLTLSLAVGNTEARYNNATSWVGFYDPGVQKLSSDYLKREGQTVMLQPWEAVAGTTRTEDIKLFSSKDSAYVTMQCTTASEYITAALDQSAVYATEEGASVRLTLTIAEKAAQLTQSTQAEVLVTMKNSDESVTLRATYRVTLLPAGTTLPDSQTSELQAGLTAANISTFAWQEPLVFSLTAADNADSVEILFNGGAFPEGTRYAVGNDQYVLGDAMTIRFPVAAGAPQPVSLDFSGTALEPQQSVSITAIAHLGEQVTGQLDMVVQATRIPISLGKITDEPVISQNGSITVPVTGDEEGLTLLVQHLERTNTGAMYVQSDALRVQLKPDGNTEGNYLLTISNPMGKAPAGTYRLTLIRMCGDQLVSTCQMVFFVYY